MVRVPHSIYGIRSSYHLVRSNAPSLPPRWQATQPGDDGLLSDIKTLHGSRGCGLAGTGLAWHAEPLGVQSLALCKPGVAKHTVVIQEVDTEVQGQPGLWETTVSNTRVKSRKLVQWLSALAALSKALGLAPSISFT
jgi:hypothetical protein